MRVLIVVDYYLPGWKGGGPIRSVANLVASHSHDHDFWVITRDRDLGDDIAYSNVEHDTWSPVGAARVWYAAPPGPGWRSLRSAVQASNPDVIMANSLFSIFTLKLLLLRRLRLVDARPLVVAPRGELGSAALAAKRVRKWLVLRLGRSLGLFSNLWWQATSDVEARQVVRWFGGARIEVVPDLPEMPPPLPRPVVHKEPGSVELVSIGRLSPIKNYPFLISALTNVVGNVHLTLYGPPEQSELESVERVAATLPGSVEVTYAGPLNPAEIEDRLAPAHWFVLATQGENFGHAIYEALRLGRPVVTSDRVPWADLKEAGAGLNVSLDKERWSQALQSCVDADNETLETASLAAHRYASQWWERAELHRRQSDAFAVYSTDA